MPNLLLALFVRFSVAKYALQRRAAAQGLVEYALILLFMAIVVIGIVSILGRTLCARWYTAMFGNGSPFGEDPGGQCPP